jgi:hypothetical protein
MRTVLNIFFIVFGVIAGCSQPATSVRTLFIWNTRSNRREEKLVLEEMMEIR